jgi:hypothetical protein
MYIFLIFDAVSFFPTSISRAHCDAYNVISCINGESDEAQRALFILALLLFLFYFCLL